MNSKEICLYTLEALKRAGADMAAVRAYKSKADELNVQAKEVRLLRTVFSTGIAIKAVKDQKKGTISINKAEKEEIDTAVAACMEALEAATPDEAEGVAEVTENANFASGDPEGDLEALYDRVREFIGQVEDKYPKVVLEELVAEYIHQELCYMTSTGVEYNEEGGLYGFSTTFSAHEGEKGSSFNYYGARFERPDKPLLSLGMTEELIRESQEALETGSVDGKFEGTIVLTPASIDNLIGTIISNFISDTPLMDGTSIWKNAKGTRVASECFNLVIDPEAEGIVPVGTHITSDGYPIHKLDLIRNGVLRNFMLSRYGAKKTGMERTYGSAANILVLPGEDALSDIIGSIEKGIYVQRLSGGSPSATGEFSGVAKNSFLIENGKITRPVSETMVSMNMAEMIKNIRGISRETANDGMGPQPWIAMDGVTISGK